MSAHVTRRIRRGLRFEALDRSCCSPTGRKPSPPPIQQLPPRSAFAARVVAAFAGLAMAVLVFLLTGCGGAVDPAPCPDTPPATAAVEPDAGACNQTKALDLWRQEHGEQNAVGDWMVSKDCYVCEILGPFGGECGYVFPN